MFTVVCNGFNSWDFLAKLTVFIETQSKALSNNVFDIYDSPYRSKENWILQNGISTGTVYIFVQFSTYIYIKLKLCILYKKSWPVLVVGMLSQYIMTSYLFFQSDGAYYYGFVFFRQTKDRSIRRGYFQKVCICFKSVIDVLLTEIFSLFIT